MIKVACIGDSITSGFSLLNPRRDSSPSLLQKMLGERDSHDGILRVQKFWFRLV